MGVFRLYRAEPQPGQSQDFERFLVDVGLGKNLRGAAGLRSARLFRRLGEDGEPAYFMLTEWEDLDAVRAFFGDSWREPMTDPAEVGIVGPHWAEHYEEIGGL